MEKTNKDVKAKNIDSTEKKHKEIKEYKWKNLNYFNKLKVKNYVVTFISIIALYIVLSFTFDPNDAFSYTKGIYINILIFVLFAVSLNITVGLMGQLNLGQAGFIAIGGYSAAFISKILVNYNLPTFLQLILVSLFGGLVAAVFGGIGSIPGAMVGGYVLGLLEAYVKGSSLTTWANPIVFGVLILILIFRPNGLFGKNMKEKV